MHVLRLCSVFEAPDQGARSLRFDPVGGMQVHTAALTRAIDRAGVQQTVLTAFRPGAPPREELGSDVRIRRVGLPVSTMRQWWALPALAHGIATEAVDLVHAHLGEDIAVLPIALAIARIHSAPLLATVHASPSSTVRAVDLRTTLVRTLGGRAERMVLPRTQRVFVLTGRAAELLRRRMPEERVEVIPLGIDLDSLGSEHPDPTLHIPHPRIVCAARLVPAKGVDVLVRAAEHLPGTHVVLLGDGPDRRKLQVLMDQRGLGGRVHMLGFVPHRQVASHLAHADVVVMPSLYEEAGRGLLEAMAVGAPVVASRVGGIPAILDGGEGGVLVPPSDVMALAAAIDHILTDPPGARPMVTRAKALATGHSQIALATAVIRAYHLAMSPGR